MKPLLVALALLAAALPFRAAAQEQAEEAKKAATGVESRMIDDWAYLPVTVVQGPYVTSFASSTTGLGNYNVDLDLNLPAGFARTKDVNYYSLLQRFDLQFAILRFLALRLNFQGEALLPDSPSSAFTLVLNGNWGGGGGLVGQIISTDRLKLSIVADYAHLQRSLFSPASALQGIAETGTLGEFFVKQNIDRVTAGGSLGFAFNKWSGFVAEAGWRGEWAQQAAILRTEGASLHFLDLALALNVNTWQHRVPLGATAFWRERIPIFDNTYTQSRQYGVGLFYSGRPYLDVGIELFDEYTRQEAGNAVRRLDRMYVAPRIRGYF